MNFVWSSYLLKWIISKVGRKKKKKKVTKVWPRLFPIYETLSIHFININFIYKPCKYFETLNENSISIWCVWYGWMLDYLNLWNKTMKQRANVSQTFSKVPYCILFMIHKCKSFDSMKTPYMHYFDHGILYENAIMKRLAK